MVSNGCHWIDHFLYLNDFARPKSWEVAIGPDDKINCSVTLANGAFFMMVLTEQGSDRIGLQDYVELRANGATAQIINGPAYRDENGERVVRKIRII